MSGCVTDHLGDYLEGDLDVQERARVDAHLIDCARCRDELRGLRATVALLRGLPVPTPPRDLTAAVMARIETERRQSWLPAALRPLDSPGVLGLLAAGLACVALMGLWEPSGVEFMGAGSELVPEREGQRTAVGDDGIRQPRRPAVGTPSPAARPHVASFAVAPLGGFAELPASAGAQRERELDRQLQWLMGDPAAFLARMGPDVGGERFARLAQYAARRGSAAEVANRLIAVSHPGADDLAPRFLAASLAADFERRAGLR